MQVQIVPDREALARQVADRIERRAASGPMTLGLSGGSTPADTYRELSRRGIDWSTVGLWLSDERWVPPDDEDSNGRLALQHLPDGVDLRRPPWNAGTTPAEAAAAYEADLRGMHPDRRPDLILLGMGDDGHTASLFPGTDALDADPGRWFVANHVPTLDTWRLTATPSLLRCARRIVVLVAGSGKADVLAEVIDGPDGRYPIQLLRDAEGDVTFVCDRDAAAGLSTS